MHHEHTAKGLLKSGATAKAGVRIYELEGETALRQALDEIGNATEHRGAQWKAAVQATQKALDDYAGAAPDLLKKTMDLAGISGAAQRAIEGLVSRANARLQAAIDAYRDGWTAPQERKWNERHPMIYAVLLLVAGTIVGIISAKLFPGAGK